MRRQNTNKNCVWYLFTSLKA